MVYNAPPPDLRIVPVGAVRPHEEHDSQRSVPLIARLREADIFTNPPIVAPLGVSQFVVLDGANRCFSFQELGYPHILVQVVSYDSGYVELDTWQHIMGDWSSDALIAGIEALNDVQIAWHQVRDAVCHIVFKDGRVMSLNAPVQTTHERNAILREVVHVYQRNATLHRTAITEPDEIWPLFPNAFAMALFPTYKPSDIIAAAKYNAFLPPGISRHLIHGRALHVNYPMEALRDRQTSLAEKNDTLNAWMQAKLLNRQIRYYAETTYQFNE